VPDERALSRRWLGILGVLVVAVFPGIGTALPSEKAIGQFRHTTFQVRDGLPQNSVDSLAQTADGYLWAGTQEGLVRFDGARFTVFDRKNTPALRHNRIIALLVDARTLWIGTEGGGLTALEGGAFRTLSAADGLPSDLVLALESDGAGTAWVGTPRGLSRVAGGRVRVFGGADGFPGGDVRALFRAPDGALFIGLADGGLLRYADGVFARIALQGPPESVLALAPAAAGGLWAGTDRRVLLVRDGRVSGVWPAPGGMPVRALREDHDGNLWIGTDGGGLARLARGRLERYGVKEGLPDGTVGAILEDREGNLWVGTQDGGLNRFSDAAFTPFSRTEGLSADGVWAIAGDRGGGIWLGTKGGGVNRLANDGSVRVLGTRDGLSDLDVQAILEDPDGTLWFGTRHGGLNRLRGGRLRVFRKGDGLSGESVSALLRDRRGTLWIGTRDGGLCRLRADGRFERVRERGAPGNAAIHALFEDREGSLWIGTNGAGLYRLRDGAFSVFAEKEGLSIGIVNVVAEDTRGSLWIGTYGGGLNRMKGGRIAAVTTRQGLFDDAVFGLVDDGLGSFWISCNKGVYRVALRELDAAADGGAARVTCTPFDTSDGMLSSECNGANQPAAFRAPDGRLWFPTVRGAVVVDPAHLPVNRVVPPVVVEEVLADGVTERPRPTLVFRPGTEKLEFRYAALSFAEPSRVRFRVKLDGYDPDWMEVGTRRTAYYTHLPPGSYTFRVLACNDSGLWNEAGAASSFRLDPTFRQTAWFWLAAALAGSVLVALGVKVQLRRASAREAELVALVAERTRQLEEANRELKLLSTTDALTGIANRRAFDEFLRLFWTQARRTGAAISVLMIDVDDFKTFNDARGHLVGDACLRKMAETLTGAVSRTGDVVARFGGEEFAVLLLDTPLAGCAVVAEQMRSRIEALAIPSERSPGGRMTVSVGAATAYPGSGLEPEELVARADVLMYRAKALGKNRVVLADAPLGSPTFGGGEVDVASA
jgi:diguanylate cyclase (GGDEF)-like protein